VFVIKFDLKHGCHHGGPRAKPKLKKRQCPKSLTERESSHIEREEVQHLDADIVKMSLNCKIFGSEVHPGKKTTMRRLTIQGQTT